ncbi:MAG: hypothetical protein KF730_03300 [Sphingomonas sp.]|uniref:hypothetical protein n=1 Tax=Sphingomonas sp. TaxID=28214 RepID=UPI0025E6B79F|nr:hypothetical protein [Sphingomonas sp.]MBX3563584.1 hypothetical protein [Sphingomonas sp.]
MRRILRAACAAMALAHAVPALAQQVPELTGFWELRDDSKEAIEPDLTPTAAERWKKLLALRLSITEHGNPFPKDWPHCSNRGNLGGMGDSAPMAIVQSPREIAIFFETNAAPRHIYMDGRDWPDPKTLEASTAGYSIGRWEGDTLVVESRGFHATRGQPAPGGYTFKTRTTERWKLIDGGQKLQLRWTFEEPAVYVKPYTFTWTYYRAPKDTYGSELLCDASDPAQSKTVEPK